MSMSYLPWRRPAAFNERPCVRDARVELTYDQFADRVDAAAEQFAALGVGPGSVVATMLPNRVELLITVMAAWRLGAAATPINPTFTASEAGYQITDSGAMLVVCADTTLDLGSVVPLHVDDLAVTSTTTPPAAKTDPADLALLVYTSGSTGRPKGVMLDHANLDAMVASMGAAITISATDHCLLVLPLFHVNAICVSFLTPLSVGAQLSVLERFHPVEFLTSVETLRPTYFSAVPTIYSHLVALPAEITPDVGSLRFAICGAAPAPPDLLAAVEARFGFGMIEGYGLSEGTCASTCNPVRGVRKPGTVGVALPGQEVAVVGPDGAGVPTGERGEVVIRGANVMRGYLNRPEATAETLVDGWLRTGDVGVLDEDGYLRIVDRIKDLIIRGGENLYPKEIENVLHGAPGVLEAAVVGGSDPVYGEVPVAFISAAAGAPLDVDAVLAHSRQHLTKVKLPVEIHVLDALPKNPVGKIDKPTLRRQLAAVGAKEA
ncbi:class I adenylate-forming enzyme family protein [Nocardioides sp. Bht2]|uniref:class I adenylate-forming enzyme family protein n=1 Tax=Nocardioides sp. Bht2 TaxID=3392297 RepID=UPI0039B38CB1